MQKGQGLLWHPQKNEIETYLETYSLMFDISSEWLRMGTSEGASIVRERSLPAKRASFLSMCSGFPGQKLGTKGTSKKSCS